LNCYQRIIKRVFDVVFSVLGLIFLLPFLIFIAIIILFIDGFPIFFSQERIGIYGNKFKIYKFRTMVVNNQKLNVTKLSDDRITSLGMVLRNNKIDELPSLVNVMLGQMSFVGPRPDVSGLYDNLNDDERKVLSFKPGITGPASLKYRNEERILDEVKDPVDYNRKIIFPDKVKINLEYINNWSFFGDIKIIFKTIFGL
tara:strand:+ start:1981 stop:2577 length:597 start_codon:yes stop_codon:yes gene_type:complete